MAFTVPAHLEAEIDELITHYPVKRSASLIVLHALQDHFGFISLAAMEWAAAKLGLPPINLYELVTFYPMFRSQPAGRFQIRICRTLSCALAGSHEVHGHLCQKLGLDPQKHGLQTTPDGQFSVEFVECLAGCDRAPVIMVNGDVYEAVTGKQAEGLLAKCA
jgi:NADH-quinone oxidoreductase subunit E